MIGNNGSENSSTHLEIIETVGVNYRRN